MENNKKEWTDYISYLNNITLTDTDKTNFFKKKAPKLLDSNEFITEAVEQNGLLLKYASKKLQDDYDIVLKAVQQNGVALEFASENLSNNKDIIYAGITTATSSVLKFVPEKFLGIKKLILEAIKYRPEELLYAADELKNDLDFLVKCIKTNHRAYLYIPKQFIYDPILFYTLISKLFGIGYAIYRKNDSFASMVNTTLNYDATIIEYLPSEYINNRNTVLKAVKSNAKVYTLLNHEFKNDRRYALFSLVSANSYLIKDLYRELPIHLKNDIEVIKLILCLYDNMFDEIPNQIKENKDLDIATLKKISEDYRLFFNKKYENSREELKNNREIAIISIIKSMGSDYKLIPRYLKNDLEIINIALFLNGEVINDIPQKLKENNAYALMAINSNGSALRFLSDKYKKDKEFVLKAVKNGASIEYLDEDFKNDKEIVFKAAENNWREFEFASEELRNDKAFISQVLDALDCTDKRRSLFNSLPDELRTNKKFCLKLVSKHWGLYSALNVELRDDMDILIEAMKQDDYPIHWASERLQSKRDYILNNIYKLTGSMSIEDDNFFNSQLNKSINDLKSFSKQFKKSLSPKNLNEIFSIAEGQIGYQIDKRDYESLSLHVQCMFGFYLGQECIKKAGGKWEWDDKAEITHYSYRICLQNQKKINPFIVIKNILDHNIKTSGSIYQHYLDFTKTGEEKDEEEESNFFGLKELVFEVDRIRKSLKFMTNKGATVIDHEVLEELYNTTDIWGEGSITYDEIKRQIKSELETNGKLSVNYIFSLIESDKYNESDKQAIIKNQNSIDNFIENLTSENLTNYFDSYEFALQAVIQNGLLLKYASATIKDNYDIVLQAVRQNAAAVQFASEELRNNNKKIVTEAINAKNVNYRLYYISGKSYDKPEVILKYVSKKLLCTKNLIYDAIKYDAEEFKYASDKLKNDKKFVLKCIKRNFEIYHYLPDSLKKDPEVFRELLLKLESFKRSFVDWEIDHKKINTFSEMVKEAFKKDGLVLKYLPTDMRNDKEIAILAMKSSIGWGHTFDDEPIEVIYRYLSDELKHDRDICKISITHTQGRSYQFMPTKLINDKEIIELALSKNTTEFNAFPKEYRDDRDFVLKAINNDISVSLEYLSDGLRDDAEIVLNVIKNNGLQFRYASVRLRDDEVFVLKAMLICNGIRTSIENREVEIFESSSKQLRSNKEFCLKAVKITWSCIRFISEQLKDDDDIILAAMETNDVAIDYASKRIKEKKEDLINNYYKLAAVTNLQENARFKRLRQDQLKRLESRIKYDWHIKLSIKNIDKILQEGVHNNDRKVESIRERDKNELIGFLGFYLGDQFIDKIGGEWEVEEKAKINKYPFYVLLDNGKSSNPFEHVKNCVADWREKMKKYRDSSNSNNKTPYPTSDCLTKYYNEVTG